LIVDSRVRTRILKAATLDITLNFKPKAPTQEHLKVFKKNFQKLKTQCKISMKALENCMQIVIARGDLT